MSDFNDHNRNIVDTRAETDRKCPDCGGVMDFNPETGGLLCPYCDHQENIPMDYQRPVQAQEIDFHSEEKTANCNWGVETKTVLCKACGAESIYDSLLTSGVCPFCGSNQVMPANTQETIAPGGVVPFRVSKKEVSSLFHKWIKRKWFCPKLAKESAKPESFQGVYLPYWTFDTQAYTEYTAEFGISRTVRGRGGKTETRIDYKPTRGVHSEFFDDQLVCATNRHDGMILNGLEPYRTTENKAYRPEYVAGFVSERYSVGLKSAWDMAKRLINNRLIHNISGRIRQEKRTSYVRNVHINPSYSKITYKYLLLPVWISNFKYRDKVYQFMVNGQTGKVSGKTPISKYKVMLTVGIGILLVAAYFFLEYYVN